MTKHFFSFLILISSVAVGFIGILILTSGFGPRSEVEPRSNLLSPSFTPEKLSWEAVSDIPWEARDSHALFVFRDKLWLLGGLSVPNSNGHVSMEQYAAAKYFNDIWVSKDGHEWTLVTASANFPIVRSASVVEYRGSLYLLGGWSPEVGYQIGIWQSKDGVTWRQVATEVPWPAREGQKVLQWQGKLWLLGGVNYFDGKVFNDVWSSSDGLHWQQVTEQTPWRPRWDEDVSVFHDKLWLAGGMGLGGAGYSDVWASADGQNWELVVEEAAWGKRQGQSLVVFRDLLWLIGGLDAETNAGVGDTWYSHDGEVWKSLPTLGPWTGREDHGVAVFQDQIWITGGMDTNWHWDNGVWFSAL